MSKEEKLLLLQLILEDIRGNWGWDLDIRVDEAETLATELGLEPHIDAISGFREHMEEGWADGRYFRMSYKNGGYIDMDKLHNLEPTIIDKSNEFKERATVLTHPDFRFEDWEKYKYK